MSGSAPSGLQYGGLAKAAFAFPIIDNHAHPLLRANHRDLFPLEGVVSEAQGDALTDHVHTTLAFFRAVDQLSNFFKLDGEKATWENIKSAREKTPYAELCMMFMKPTSIQCILIDDGLRGVAEYAENYKWHDQFTTSPTKRIVRVEAVAEDILEELCNKAATLGTLGYDLNGRLFRTKFDAYLRMCAADREVAGFKSVVCYRTGLDISLSDDPLDVQRSLETIIRKYLADGKRPRICDKPLNDYIVRTTLEIASQAYKPVQFHTGLGDSDLTLTLANPALMQSVIKAFPSATFVLLHSGYPFTREAGYLTSVYKNVYLDFGEVFPMISSNGQKEVFRQVLELCPTNKIMWSTDGHWWPESYYLATIQARTVIYEVLAESVQRRELTEHQTISVVENAFFHVANKLYNLNLVPEHQLTLPASKPSFVPGWV